MSKIHCIHDKTFKTMLADIKVARDFFKEYLPKNVLSMVDLKTLKISKNSFIDESLKEFSSDVLYEVKLKNGNLAFFYLLCEHQSEVDSLMPFRLLNYMVRIWKLYLDQTGDNFLPLIFPLVFFHGKTPYDGPRTLSELIRGPAELVQEILTKPFYLIDTHDIEDEDLRHKKWVGILTFMFKHVFARDIWSFVEPMIELLKPIQTEKGAAVFTGCVLQYWLYASEIKATNPKAFVESVQQRLALPIGDELMTMAEQLKQEGRQEGRQEGGGILLIHQLERKFKIKTIPERYRQKIQQANSDRLLEWGDKIVDSECKSLEEVFDA